MSLGKRAKPIHFTYTARQMDWHNCAGPWRDNCLDRFRINVLIGPHIGKNRRGAT